MSLSTLEADLTVAPPAEPGHADVRPDLQRTLAVERGLTVGGQAIIEGVMMRGPDQVAMAARRPDGSIALRVDPLPSWSGRLARVPLVRGVAALAESVYVGVGALQWSASIADPRQRSRRVTAGSLVMAAGAMFAAFVVFTAVPAVIAAWTIPLVGPLGRTAAEGLLGVAMLVAYIAMIRHHPMVLRTFGYHGAEHKAIAAYESDGPLHALAASAFTTRHERCGTTFMLDVAVLSALIHIVTNTVWPSGPLMIAARVIAIPLVAGIAYEVLRATARHPGRAFTRVLTKPGMMLQAMTTDEPGLDQLEVAVVALRAAVPDVALPDAALPGAAFTPSAGV
ncbi:MAG: DUF1385 domain-containing protein [Acidimicrobiia bacterium]|nr:DUF1385 domain-containing protein [Acidimicrobiia bacterium]